MLVRKRDCEERDERETFMNSQTASLDLELKFEVGDGDR